MTKVVVHERPQITPTNVPPPPTKQVLDGAAQPQTVTDARGRQITIKKLSALDRMHLFKAVGPDNARNQMYLGYATLARAVVAINGEPEPPPGTEKMIENLVARLDDDGLNAIGEGYAKHYGVSDSGESGDLEQIKN